DQATPLTPAMRKLLGPIFLLAVAACHSTPAGPADPSFEGLEGPHRAIRTSSPAAQRLFDQGWTLYCGFNHEEAIRSFQAALRHDQTCAMAWFGIGLSYGPNINNPTMDESTSQLAYSATQNALAYS